VARRWPTAESIHLAYISKSGEYSSGCIALVQLAKNRPTVCGLRGRRGSGRGSRHGRLDILVAEKLLDGADVISGLEEVGCE
jgi:hypothetical protein